jgi:hypothetical protein
MPKSRTKSAASKNVAAASSAPMPLLDSMRAQMQPSNAQNNDTDSDIDHAKVSASGWQCDIDDWSVKKSSNNESDVYPLTLRSIQRKNEQTKNNFFPFSHDDNQIKQSTSDNIIDISKLSLIITDLITGKRDQSAYTDFLSILEHFSVHTTRDDHLEESIYHLIQAGVSFIRSNEERFDPLKLEECYRRRHILKTNSVY